MDSRLRGNERREAGMPGNVQSGRVQFLVYLVVDIHCLHAMPT